jgi:transcriptional regulator with PAS, ATPase and Fis domain
MFESISLPKMHGNYLFIDTSQESLLSMNEIENILKALQSNIGIAVVVVGEDVNSISSKRKGTLHVDAKDASDKAVANLIKNVRKALDRFAGNSAYTRNLKRDLISFAFFDPNVLILGETGTGKTLLANIIHEIVGKRKKFIALNSATIPVSLMESELFGHAKGAYTSADSSKEGIIAQADGGHIFFDEIAELPLHIQAKLFHVVEEGTYNMVGDSKIRRVNVRFISATNREETYLRKDLFFRISERVIKLPPLRQRKDDIPEIINFIFKSNGYDLKFQDISEEDQNAFLSYNYPGNIRELQNIVRAYISEGRAKIPSQDDESQKITMVFSKSSELPSQMKGNVVDFILEMVDGILRNGFIPPYLPLKETVESQFEIIYLTKILKMFKWNKHEVADRLGISYRYLNKLISKYNLDRRTKKDAN